MIRKLRKKNDIKESRKQYKDKRKRLTQKKYMDSAKHSFNIKLREERWKDISTDGKGNKMCKMRLMTKEKVNRMCKVRIMTRKMRKKRT